MVTKSRARSEKSGRATGTSTTESGWFDPAMAELRNITTIAVRDYGEDSRPEAEHAILWAGNWLVSYDAGWCTLHELLDATKRVGRRLPPLISRLLLGIVAHKALLTTPRRLGEQKAKTSPHLVRCLGAQVQGFLFDDDGSQLSTVDEAVASVRQFVIDRDLLQVIPSHEIIKQWFTEWRAQEEATAPVPRPKAGRPKIG